MLVSVVIPAYNSNYVRAAIESILSQTHRDLDVIVVDDGSPGQAIEFICAYFPSVRYIRQANAGPSAARNRGIREAKGEWIAFLDDDDIWLPEKIAKQISVIAGLPIKERIGLIYTGQYMIQDETLLGGKVHEANGMIYHYLLFGNFIGTCSSIMIPKYVFERVGGFDESLICSQDFDLYLRIAREYEIHSVSEPLIKYRTRPDQISRDPTLNNADDRAILLKQQEYVDTDLFCKVEDFHRRLSGLRYKETAYDSLFRLKDRLAYWKWILKGAAEAKTLPSATSLAYLALTVMPAGVIDCVARMKSRGGVESHEIHTSIQKVAEDFSWMGVRRGSIQNLTPDATGSHS